MGGLFHSSPKCASPWTSPDVRELWRSVSDGADPQHCAGAVIRHNPVALLNPREFLDLHDPNHPPVWIFSEQLIATHIEFAAVPWRMVARPT